MSSLNTTTTTTSSSTRVLSLALAREAEEKRSRRLQRRTTLPRSVGEVQHHGVTPTRVTLSFGLRAIGFSKKASLPFFLALELRTGQKAIATLARKQRLAWKIRKGALLGCTVTLRGTGLASFRESLQQALPRMEKLLASARTQSGTKGADVRLLRTKGSPSSAEVTLGERGLFSGVESVRASIESLSSQVGVVAPGGASRASLQMRRPSATREETRFLLRATRLPRA